MSTDVPAHLGSAGRQLWAELDELEFDPNEHRVRVAACETADEIDRLDRIAKAADPVVLGSQGQPVIHPCIAEARFQRALMAKLLYQLRATDEAEERTLKARHAANTRWAT